jgi:hypothetical protein
MRGYAFVNDLLAWSREMSATASGPTSTARTFSGAGLLLARDPQHGACAILSLPSAEIILSQMKKTKRLCLLAYRNFELRRWW